MILQLGSPIKDQMWKEVMIDTPVGAVVKNKEIYHLESREQYMGGRYISNL